MKLSSIRISLRDDRNFGKRNPGKVRSIRIV